MSINNGDEWRQLLGVLWKYFASYFQFLKKMFGPLMQMSQMYIKDILQKCLVNELFTVSKFCNYKLNAIKKSKAWKTLSLSLSFSETVNHVNVQ